MWAGLYLGGHLALTLNEMEPPQALNDIMSRPFKQTPQAAGGGYTVGQKQALCSPGAEPVGGARLKACEYF